MSRQAVDPNIALRLLPLDLAETAKSQSLERTLRPLCDSYRKPMFKDVIGCEAAPRHLAYCEQDLAVLHDSYSTQRLDCDYDYRDYHVALLAHAPDRIPVIEGPLRKARITSNGELNYGYVNVSGKNSSAYEEARSHLSKDPTLRSVWLQLEDGCTFRSDAISGETAFTGLPTETRVRTVRGLLSSTGLKHGTITWRTKRATFCKNGTGELVGVSAATSLAHEGVHRFNQLAAESSFIARLATPAGRYTNREEFVTIRREWGLTTRTDINEGKRTSHYGVALSVPSLTSIKVSRLKQRYARALSSLEPSAEGTTALAYGTQLGTAYAIARIGPGWASYVEQQIQGLTAKNSLQRFVRKVWLRPFS